MRAGSRGGMRQGGGGSQNRHVLRPGSFLNEDAEEETGRRRKFVRPPVERGFAFTAQVFTSEDAPASTSANFIVSPPSIGTGKTSGGFTPPPFTGPGTFNSGFSAGLNTWSPPPAFTGAAVATPLADLSVRSTHAEPASTSAVGLGTDAAFFPQNSATTTFMCGTPWEDL